MSYEKNIKVAKELISKYVHVKHLFFVYGMISAIACSYLYFGSSFTNKLNGVKAQITAKQEIIKKKDAKIENIQKRLDTINEFMEQVKLKELMEKNKSQEKLIQDYETKMNFLKSRVNKLESELNTIEEQNSIRMKNLNQELEAVTLKHKNEINEYLKFKKSKEKELELIKKNNLLIDKSRKYQKDDITFTNFVIKLEMLKAICKLTHDDMDYKKIVYDTLINNLKHLLRKDQFIKKLKPVKIYTEPPLLAELKTKYTTSKEDLDKYTLESNERIIKQVDEIITHLNQAYLQ